MAPRMPRPALLILVASLLAAPALAGDEHEPRVETARYVAGPGDLVCFVTGFGCLRFLVQDHESAITVTFDDEVHDPVAADICAPTCDVATAHICGSGTLTGLTPGVQVFVFINLATGADTCPVLQLGTGFKGTATAVFT